ncbi:globin-coupled sensor protein [Natrialbaceae archaeon GCM10025810]|uniref:globin-coupled sensor protein n=1 Tax=Halovalidus salilacus TaxID=3075124 RepID=UPI003614D9A8
MQVSDGAAIGVGAEYEDVAREYEVDRAEIERVKTAVGFDERDERLLASQSTVFEGVSGPLAARYADGLRTSDAVRRSLEDHGTSLEGVERAQREYVRSFGRGPYDAQFFEERVRTPGFPALLEAGPDAFLGSFAAYYEGVLEALADDVKSEFVEEDGSEPTDPAVEGGVAEERAPDGYVPIEAVDAVAERALAFLRVATIDQQLAVRLNARAYRERVRDELEQQETVRKNVGDSLEELSVSAEEVSDSSQDISELADEQSETVSNVAGEISNLSATVEEIASNAEEVSSTSEHAQEIATESADTAEHAIAKMERVERASTDVTRDVEALREGVRKIDDIIEVINTIADQTNLLALNASIEAATAGEAGDGFAVVAKEVKSLAEESQEESKRIERLVDEIRRSTRETVESLETANEEVADGVDLVEETVDDLERIREAVTESVQGIREVAAATDDQAATTEEVASTTDAVMEGVRELSDEVREIVAANEQQTAMIEEITDEVRRLSDEDDLELR